jgi:hypothetical protein
LYAEFLEQALGVGKLVKRPDNNKRNSHCLPADGPITFSMMGLCLFLNLR